jgi:hypothetical protein
VGWRLRSLGSLEFRLASGGSRCPFYIERCDGGPVEPPAGGRE